MRQCILAATITGSCALLYLLYRMGTSLKRKNSITDEKSDTQNQKEVEGNENEKSIIVNSSNPSSSGLKSNENSCIEDEKIDVINLLECKSDKTNDEIIINTEGSVESPKVILFNEKSVTDIHSQVIMSPVRKISSHSDGKSVIAKGLPDSSEKHVVHEETADIKPKDSSNVSENEYETKKQEMHVQNSCNMENHTANSGKKSNESLRSSVSPSSPSKNRKKRKDRRNNQSKNESDTPSVDGQRSKKSDKSSHKENPLPSHKESLSPPPDQVYTSDLERESSHTPEQENITDNQSSVSQASFDSGQGSLEVDHETIFSNIPSDKVIDPYIFYQFKVPQELVGRLIGRKGAFVNKIRASTSTDIVIVDYVDNDFKLCSVEGEKINVSKALDKIRDYFPLDQFPDLSMEQLNTPAHSPQHQPQMNRQILQLDIPPGVVLEVQASAVITTGELWLQQPLHPTFSALQNLHHCLNLNYGDGSSSPVLPMPIPENTVCVCQIGSQWFRCQIVNHDETVCTVTLLDVGGTVSLPVVLLRQIRGDYISLPFQATRCYLYGVQPCSESGWIDEGRKVLLEVVKNDILYATIAAYSQDGIPLINLYQRKLNQYVLLNKSLVDMGHAKWMVMEGSK